MATSRELRMFLNASFTLLLLGILTSVLVTGQECGLRNTAAAGRSCERACGDGGTCRKENRECVCDGLCGLSCLKKACPLLQSPVEGYVTVTPSQHYIDAVARYRCNRDFTLVGNSNRTCQRDKTWSGSEPVCRELSDSAPVLAETHHCSFLLFPTNGVVAYYEERRIEGTIATYRCDDGYTLIGNKNRTCLREGSWSGSDPDCVVVSCPDVNIQDGNVHHGEVNRISREGDEIIFSCNEGFQLRYPQRTTCTSGQWTQALPYCEEDPCSEDDIGVGQWRAEYNRVSVERGTRPHGTTATFVCTERGHRTSDTKQCLTGQWRGDAPTCTKILCPPIAIQNGRVRYTLDARLILTLEQNTTATFTCNNGYYKSHHNSSSCDLGIWTNEPPRCIEEPCSESSIDFGYWEAVYNTPESEPGSGYRLGGTIATFNCLQYGYATDVQQTCRLGSWDGQRPFCRKIPCEGENLNNGRVEYSSDRVEHGTDRSYICDDGFTLRGNGASTCDAGQWTRELPECVEDIRCPAPGNVSNGRWAYVRASANRSDPHAYILNEKVTLQCNPGYHASSNRESWCNYQGQWSPPLSSCIAD